ncbi:MAG: hypothetical protein KGJ45_11490 [Elusimicrobia bacterium]|nr:hypothetical protein [Elusimicrobiota bacterium]
MSVDWKWFAAWIALWVILIAAAELSPGSAELVGVFAVGLSLTAIGELIYSGKLQKGLQTLGVPV